MYKLINKQTNEIVGICTSVNTSYIDTDLYDCVSIEAVEYDSILMEQQLRAETTTNDRNNDINSLLSLPSIDESNDFVQSMLVKYNITYDELLSFYNAHH